MVARNQQVVRIDEEREAEVSAEDRAQLAAAACGCAGRGPGLVFQDYDKGVCSAPLIKPLIGAAKQRGVPIVVDPKFRHFFELFRRDGVQAQPARIDGGGGFGGGSAAGEALAAIRRRVGADELLITLGSDGMILVAGEGRLTRIHARAREVFDISGAGDTATRLGRDGLGRGRLATLDAARLAAVAAGSPSWEARGRGGDGGRGACRLGDIRLGVSAPWPGRLAQLVRARASHARGRGFKSLIAHRLIRKPRQVAAFPCPSCQTWREVVSTSVSRLSKRVCWRRLGRPR